jgi:chemotaxis methyl-accepting protein methylase
VLIVVAQTGLLFRHPQAAKWISRAVDAEFVNSSSAPIWSTGCSCGE